MRYVICTVLIAIVASQVMRREVGDIARRIGERDEEYRQQLLAAQEADEWLK